MKKISLLFILAIILTGELSYPEESWIIPMDSPYYKQAEELFLNSGRNAPYEEMPLVADELKAGLSDINKESQDEIEAAKARDLNDKIKLPFKNLAPILEFGLNFGFNNETGRMNFIYKPQGKYDNGGTTPTIPPYNLVTHPGAPERFLDYKQIYQTQAVPSLITTGLIAQKWGISICIVPEIRPAMSQILTDYSFMNFPTQDPKKFDLNVPYRGVLALYKDPVEIRFGRDKLQLGPGRWSSLMVNKNIPYNDFIKFRLFMKYFSFSFYFISLNAQITAEESAYMNLMYNNPTLYPNPEKNGSLNGATYNMRSKNLVASKWTFTPADWAAFSLTQYNLIGGRDPHITDFNPFIIFHNIYAEGVYSVPISLTATFTPYKGIKIYGEFLFYDASVGDEASGPDSNGFAAAYQIGLTLLSNPFFQAGPGRFRLDAEFSWTDPWVYGKFYSLRQFTSRIIQVEPFGDRYMIDYPLGFYLGPDAFEIDVALAYGTPDNWEIELLWQRQAKGVVNMYGFGADNDYGNYGVNGVPLANAATPTGSARGSAEWTDSIKLSFTIYPVNGLKVWTWYQFKHVENRFNITGYTGNYHQVGASATYKLY